MPPEASQRLMKDRENKITHEAKKDIHESNPEYLKKCYEVTCSLVEKFNWHEVKCVNEQDEIRTIDDIHNEIYNEIKKEIQLRKIWRLNIGEKSERKNS